jgi:hypothetical protein
MMGNAALSPAALASTNEPAAGARFRMDSRTFRENFDRQPFGFSHDLSALEVFQYDELTKLAERYADHPRDYFVSASAPSAGTDFDSVPHGWFGPHQAMSRLDTDAIRILLKRPENHDPRFRRLLDELFAEVTALRGGMGGERLVRLESAVFITSAAATTPFHFDPETAFFSQIAGEKIYHVYPPTALREADLENFYLTGVVSIGQVDLQACDPGQEHVFTLHPGMGLHQPQNSPHWVETRASRSISYSFVFETDASRARGRARAFNHYLRRLGLMPRLPGANPSRDSVKAGAMRIVIPIRNRIRAKLRAALARGAS